MKDNALIHYGILGQKWGVRRYQNKDGTLTSAGQERYARDKRENDAKKKDKRIDVSSPDPKRWVKEDLDRSQRVVDASSNLVKTMQKFEKESRESGEVKKPTLDLSAMSDSELRERINRKLLEQQYNNLFSTVPPVRVSKGRQFLKNTMDIAGDVLMVSGSALAIARAIKELKG